MGTPKDLLNRPTQPSTVSTSTSIKPQEESNMSIAPDPDGNKRCVLGPFGKHNYKSIEETASSSACIAEFHSTEGKERPAKASYECTNTVVNRDGADVRACWELEKICKDCYQELVDGKHVSTGSDEVEQLREANKCCADVSGIHLLKRTNTNPTLQCHVCKDEIHCSPLTCENSGCAFYVCPRLCHDHLCLMHLATLRS